MAENVISLKVLLEANTANMKLGELEDHFAQLQEAIRGVPRGSKEFDQLSNSIARTSAEIKNIELGFEGLDREGVASQLGGLAGGIGEVTASLVLMGGENETMQEMAASIEKAMAISMGFKGAIEGLSAASKLYNNLLKQGKVQVMAKAAVEKVAAVGTWMLNAANKALNTTMKMNPIGLVVTALAAVVGGIIYFKDEIWSLIKSALKPLQSAIDAVVDALQWLGIMESDSAIATRKAEEEKARAALESAEKRTEATEKLIKAHTKLTDSIVADMDFEIRKRKANGKETTELELEKLRVLIEAAKKERELQAQRREDLRQEIMLRLQQGKVFGTELSENMKALEESFKAEEKLKADQLQAEQDLEISLIQIKKAGTEKRKKVAVEQKKIDEKAAEDAIKLEKEKNQLLEDLEAKAIEDKTTRSLAELEIAQERERQQLVEKYGLDTELMIALEEEQLLQMNTLIEGIEQEARDKKAEADKEALDKELENIETARQAKIEAVEKGLALAQQTAQSIMSVNDAVRDNALASIDAEYSNETAKRKLTEAEEFAFAKRRDSILKVHFERKKKMDIAMAAINTSQAILQALASAPPPLNFVLAGAAGAAGALQIAAISKQKFAGTAQIPTAPSSADVTPTGPDAGGGAAITPVSNTSTILGNQQVFVTETDITNTQNNVSVIEESATF